MKNNKNNILGLDQYINEALYNKKSGYYMNSNPFGEKGDYITSPNISIIFSEMIAIWIISFWENLRYPKKFNLIELGAGNGEMMNQIIKTFEKFPDFRKACKINILEKSNYLKKIQNKKLKDYDIKWLKNLNEISNIPNIFIANEFFDALPIKQFIKKNNVWFEKKIKYNAFSKPSYLDILADMKKLEKKIDFNISYKQDFVEFSPLALDYLKIISKKINNNSGGILIIDYGYWDSKMKDTIKSIYKHKFNDILTNFGKADITHNISFKLLIKILQKFNLKINGKINQGDFLQNLGILKRAEIISKTLPFSKKADIYYRIKRLIDKNLMGQLFKVIFATKKNIKFQIGFKN